MILKLQAPGNPDLQQYAKVAPTIAVKVSGYEHASEVARKYIKEHNLGAGNFVAELYAKEKDRKPCAIVAYNGKVFADHNSCKLLWAPEPLPAPVTYVTFCKKCKQTGTLEKRYETPAVAFLIEAAQELKDEKGTFINLLFHPLDNEPCAPVVSFRCCACKHYLKDIRTPEQLLKKGYLKLKE